MKEIIVQNKNSGEKYSSHNPTYTKYRGIYGWIVVTTKNIILFIFVEKDGQINHCEPINEDFNFI